MILRLEEIDAPPAYLINQPVLLSDPSRPAACQHIFEWLGLTHAGEGTAENGFQQFKNTQRRVPFNLDPILEVLAKLGLKHRLLVSHLGQVSWCGEVPRAAQASPCGVRRALKP